MLYGRLAMCLNVFLLAWLSEDAVLQSILERNTPIWARLLNVAVYETWVISSKLMKRPGSMTYMLHLRSRLTGSHVLIMILSETCSHQTCNSRRSLLFKLWISVAWSSRWEFNLAVLTETLVYQIAVKNWQISKWAFEIWRGIHGILGLAHYEFQKFQINLKAKAHMCVHEGASGGSL